MGLFDFFRKKKSSEETLEVQQNVSDSLSTSNDDSMTRVVNTEVSTTKDIVEVTSEQGEVISLDVLLKTATPSKQGLYPHEIMMLDYAHAFKTDNNTFQNFWYWQYSITDPQVILDSLCERGFIKVGDLRSALEKLKLTEIKEELKRINQKVTGKKVELVDRLVEFGDLSSLDQKYAERYYVLTSKGEEELKENQYVPYLHRHRYMTCWEMNNRIARTNYSYRDILWGYFNEQSDLNFRNFNFGLYRNTRLDMYQFLMEEKKYKTAFQLLCEVLAFDLGLLRNGDESLIHMEESNPKLYLMMYESRLSSLLPYEKDKCIIPPAISNWFAEMKTIFGVDDGEYRDFILKELNEIHPPHRIFTNEECADIIIAEMLNDVGKLEIIFKTAEMREAERLMRIRTIAK